MNLIRHVAIIMDGNGRWGIKKNKSRNSGHEAGLVAAEKIIRETIKKKIKYLTLYAFSTENWKRPKTEIKFLFNLLKIYLQRKTQELNKKGIKFKVIGNKKILPIKLLSTIKESEKTTKNNNLAGLDGFVHSSLIAKLK